MRGDLQQAFDGAPELLSRSEPAGTDPMRVRCQQQVLNGGCHATEVGIVKPRIQIAMVVASDGRLLGTVTDGDIRRGILRGVELDQAIGQVMNTHPVTALIGTSRDELLALMTSRTIKQVPLVNEGDAIFHIASFGNAKEVAAELETFQEEILDV